MPLLATFIGAMASSLASLFARFMGFSAALKLASFITWLAVITAFAAAVHGCLAALYGMVSGGSGGGVGGGGSGAWVQMFWMGLGMFIPANASAVLSCIGSVWIACQMYKINRDGLHNYSK